MDVGRYNETKGLWAAAWPDEGHHIFLDAREMDKLEVSVVAILVVVMNRQWASQGPTP